MKQLESETGKVVARKQAASVQDTVRKLRNVQSCEGVDFARIATEFQRRWVLSSISVKVGEQETARLTARYPSATSPTTSSASYGAYDGRRY